MEFYIKNNLNILNKEASISEELNRQLELIKDTWEKQLLLNDKIDLIGRRLQKLELMRLYVQRLTWNNFMGNLFKLLGAETLETLKSKYPKLKEFLF